MKRFEILEVISILSLVGVIVFQQYQISGMYSQHTELRNDYDELMNQYIELQDMHTQLNASYQQLSTDIAELQVFCNQLNASYQQLLSSLEEVTVLSITGASSTGAVIIEAKSVGGRNVEIINFILKDSTGNTLGIQTPGTAWILPSTEETKITTVTFSGLLTLGNSYTVVLVTKLGNTFESPTFATSEQERVSIVSVAGEGTADVVTIYAKSVGGGPVTITDIVLKDSAGTTLGVSTLGTPVVLPADGTTTLISATFTGLMTVGEYYTATLVSQLGNTFVSPAFKAS